MDIHIIIVFRTASGCVLMSSAIFLETLQAAKSLRKECNTNNIEVISSGSFLTDSKSQIKSVSMRKPGRTRQGVIMLKSPISLKLGTNVRYQELTYVTEFQVKILNSLGDPGIPCKNRHFARFMHN